MPSLAWSKLSRPVEPASVVGVVEIGHKFVATKMWPQKCGHKNVATKIYMFVPDQGKRRGKRGEGRGGKRGEEGGRGGKRGEEGGRGGGENGGGGRKKERHCVAVHDVMHELALSQRRARCRRARST